MNLAQLAAIGVRYGNASTPFASNSFPGALGVQLTVRHRRRVIDYIESIDKNRAILAVRHATGGLCNSAICPAFASRVCDGCAASDDG